jgi:hypothetical protein
MVILNLRRYKLTKLIAILILITAFSANYIFAQHDEHKDEKYEVKGKELSDGTLYGDDIEKAAITGIKISDIFANLDSYQHKVVVVEGNVTEVCQTMGCNYDFRRTNEIRAMTLHKFFCRKI